MFGFLEELLVLYVQSKNNWRRALGGGWRRKQSCPALVRPLLADPQTVETVTTHRQLGLKYYFFFPREPVLGVFLPGVGVGRGSAGLEERRRRKAWDSSVCSAAQGRVCGVTSRSRLPRVRSLYFRTVEPGRFG